MTPWKHMAALAAVGLASLSAPVANAAGYFGGRVEVIITIQLVTPVPSGSTVDCGASVVSTDINTTAGTATSNTENGVATASVSGSTATCTVEIPYLWVLANQATDQMEISYTVGYAGTSTTISSLIGARFGTHSLGSVPVPAAGTVTSYSVTTRL